LLTSENGLELIRKSEPLELVAYLCPAGKWTIGYDHTGPEVNKGMKIDIFDAIIMLRNDVKKAESAIAELVKVPLSQNQFDALVSFTFSVGQGISRPAPCSRS